MKKINLGFKLNNKFHQKEVLSQLRKAYGIKKIFTWARPLICPFDKFIFQIPKNQSIFDVGCGDGNTSPRSRRGLAICPGHHLALPHALD